MKNICGFFVVVITLMLLSPAATKAEFITLRGLISDSYIDGKIKSDKGGSAGTMIDMRGRLGATDSAQVPEVEMKLSIFPDSRFVMSYIPASYEGKKRVGVSGGINFGGKNFANYDIVKTTMDVGIGSLYFESLFKSESMSSVMSPEESDYGFLIGVKYIHTDTTLTSAYDKRTAQKTSGVPFPVVGIRLQGMIMEKVQMEFSYYFSSLRAQDIRVYWSDFYTELKFNQIPVVPIGLGYKITKSVVDDKNGDDWFSSLGFEGLYLSASLTF